MPDKVYASPHLEHDAVPNHQLAQINIARARFELDKPEMAGFTSRLDEINELADCSPGFVWRLHTEDGDAASLRVFPDPLLIVNMSVWRDVDALKQFVFKTAHLELLKSKASWFEKPGRAHHAMWWIDPGTTPTLDVAKQKLELVSQIGPTAEAFTFSRIFQAPEV